MKCFITWMLISIADDIILASTCYIFDAIRVSYNSIKFYLAAGVIKPERIHVIKNSTACGILLIKKLQVFCPQAVKL